MGAACTENIWESYPVHDWLPVAGDAVGIGVFVVGIVYYINSILTFMWIQAQRGKALHGDETAARYVIFPIYVPFMWTSAVSDVIVASLLIFSDVNLTDSNNWSNAVFVAITFAFQHFAIEGVAFLLMQYGCGRQASIRAGSVGFLWVLVTFSIYVCVLRFSYTVMISLEIIIESALFLFYLAMWKLPLTSLFRRRALIPYARFWCIFRLLALLLDIFSVAAGGCYKHFYVFPLITLVIAKPYMIYFTLLNDSAWWQGASGTMKPGEGQSDQLFSPLLGIEVSYSGAQELAQEIDNLNTQGTVKLLNFAYLSLNSSYQLGSGSFSKVYSGAYKGTPVAIKLLFTVDLNPEVIKRCSSEAQILTKISHPNVVDIFGVAVLPPSVCIVLEICHYGSLSDVIRGGIIARNGEIIQRNPLGLTITDKMFLALGCARGLHALHSFDKTLVHRDIKSSNFLVDGQLNAKICDLELGGSSATSIDAVKDGMLCTWQAPEVMRGNDFTQASDIYALGLVLWEIITGKVPFAEYGRGRDEIMYQVLRGARPYIEISENVPPSYYQLIEACWADEVSTRPDSASIVYELYLNCWLYTVHSRIVETVHTVDNKALIECYEAERSSMVMKTAFSNYRPQNRRGSMPVVVSQALSTVRREPQWEMLEEAGAFLILSAEFPFLVLGATKKWSQITGFLLSDIIARDLSFLEGTLSNKVLLRYTCSEASQGRAAHAVVTHYRRDGTSFINSLHAVPIYDGNYYRSIGTLAPPVAGDAMEGESEAELTDAGVPPTQERENNRGGDARLDGSAAHLPRPDAAPYHSGSFRGASAEGSGNSSSENHRALLAAIGASYEGGTMVSPSRNRALSAHLSAAIVPPVQVNPDNEDSMVRHQRKAEVEELERKRALDAVEKKYLRRRGDSKGSIVPTSEPPAPVVVSSNSTPSISHESSSLSVSQGVKLSNLTGAISIENQNQDLSKSPKSPARVDSSSGGLGFASSSPRGPSRVSFLDMERGTLFVPGSTPPTSLTSRDSKLGSTGSRPSDIIDDSSTAPRTAYIVLQFAVISNAR